MPTLNVSEQTFRLLSEQAVRTNTSIDEVIASSLAKACGSGDEPSVEDRLRAFERWTNRIASRADRYPPGHLPDDSRESIYEERENAQL